MWSECDFIRDTKGLESIGLYTLEFIKAPSRNVEVSLLLTDLDEMHRLNKQYRGIDKPTNILSFEGDIPDPQFNDPDMTYILGSVAVGYEVATQEAIQQEKSFRDHFFHLIVHALLHLNGYDHETLDEDRLKMEACEIAILDHFNIENPYE